MMTDFNGIVSARDNMKIKRRIRRSKKEQARKSRLFTHSRSKYNSIEKSLMERTSQRHQTLNKHHNITIMVKNKDTENLAPRRIDIMA